MDKKLKTAATFGGALAAMGVAPELQADIVNLTFNPSSFAFQNTNSVSTLVDIVEVPGSFEFAQWNDAIGKTLFNAQIGLNFVSVSQNLDPATFNPFYTAIGFTTFASGTTYIGFNAGGNVGWFAINLGGFQGAITYVGGAYGNAGEIVHVPAPGALALLALGAVGLRRKRSR